MKTWLITGATGFIGRELVRLLAREAASQDQYVLLVRSAPKLKALLAELPQDQQERFLGAQGDLAHLDALQPYGTLFEGVVHMAGLVDAKHPRDFDRVNFQGTVNLHRWVMTQTRVSNLRWIQVSSIAANGPVTLTAHDCRPDIDQDCPTSAYGRSKLAADQYLRQHHPAHQLVVVRPPAVFGPEDQAWIPALKLLRRRMMPLWTGQDCPYFSFIDVETLARLLCVLMQGIHSIHETLYPSFGQPVHWNQLLGMTRRALGLEGRLAFPIPLRANWLRWLAGGLDVLSRIPGGGRLFPYGGDKLRLLSGGHLVKDGYRQLERFGISSPRDMTAQWNACVQHWKQT